MTQRKKPLPSNLGTYTSSAVCTFAAMSSDPRFLVLSLLVLVTVSVSATLNMLWSAAQLLKHT